MGEADQGEGDYSQYSVETLCLPGSLNYPGEKKSPPTENTWRQRWMMRVERDNLKMSVHNKSIPMGYTGTSTLVQRTWSVSEGAITHLRIEKELTWAEDLKFLLLKSLLVSAVYFNKKHLGKTLNCEEGNELPQHGAVLGWTGGGPHWTCCVGVCPWGCW